MKVYTAIHYTTLLGIIFLMRPDYAVAQSAEELRQSIRTDAMKQQDEFMAGSSEDSREIKQQRETERVLWIDKIIPLINTESLSYGFGKNLVLLIQTEDDPSYDADKRFEQERDKLPPQLWGRAAHARSEVEIQFILLDGEALVADENILRSSQSPKRDGLRWVRVLEVLAMLWVSLRAIHGCYKSGHFWAKSCAIFDSQKC